MKNIGVKNYFSELLLFKNKLKLINIWNGCIKLRHKEMQLTSEKAVLIILIF